MTINVIFFGTPHFAVPGLTTLIDHPEVIVKAVVTQPDKPAGRGGAIQPSPVKLLAVEKGIPVLQPKSIRKELDLFLSQIEHLGSFDIGVVIAFGQILPLQVLKHPRVGCVNVHASLLPRWRGAAPIHRAILAGDSETGVCLMDMDEGLDTGGVFVEGRTPITPQDTIGTLHDRLGALGGSLLRENLTKIVSGELISTPQLTEGITYASKITPSEALIDWTLSAEEVDRKVRALNPFPSAYTVWQGKRVKIQSGAVVTLPIPDFSSPLQSPLSLPGTVVSSLPDRLEIATGKGSYRILSLQLEGKRRMSVPEFLNGSVLPVGALFCSPAGLPQ